MYSKSPDSVKDPSTSVLLKSPPMKLFCRTLKRVQLLKVSYDYDSVAPPVTSGSYKTPYLHNHGDTSVAHPQVGGLNASVTGLHGTGGSSAAHNNLQQWD